MAKKNMTPYYAEFQKDFKSSVAQAKTRRVECKTTQAEVAQLLQVSLRQIAIFEKGLAESAYLLHGYSQLFPVQ
jgi:DNA-binding XRE family transcriptional regulator